MKKVDDLPIILCLAQQDWDSWLHDHHRDSKGVWLKIAKKGGAGNSSVSYSEALDSALCYGWIDGQKASFDDEYWLQKFTPRTSTSKWSKINREKATELLDSGRMQPAGARELERAKADGRWEGACLLHDPATSSGT
jgi:uncharacterized protein YdeI (YjbR/CyaY-like superfamily)